MKNILVFFIALLLFAACESQSGKRHRANSGDMTSESYQSLTDWTTAANDSSVTIDNSSDTSVVIITRAEYSTDKLEKVQIIYNDRSTGRPIKGTYYYHYKIYRPDLEVTAYAFIANIYDKGDIVLINKSAIQ